MITKQQIERAVVALENLASAHQQFADTLTRELDPNGDTVSGRISAAAEGLHQIARSIIKLGLNDAGTGMGAIEALSLEVKNLGDAIVDKE